MEKRLLEIRRMAQDECTKATTCQELGEVRVKYLGRKGLITKVLRNIGTLSPEERPSIGKLANLLKEEISLTIEKRWKQIEEIEREKKRKQEIIDITLPGRPFPIGRRHPVTQIFEEMVEIFTRLGFSIAEGPEVELDYYNFEALNIPKDHPARDMQDTFYISDEVVLRTHTSPVQIRTMEKQKPPVRIIVPGKVYRCDADISHSPMFHQLEGLMVDRGITFGNLKGILEVFVHQMFGKETKLRFRPSFFPFTEPSAEVDITCVVCRGEGCRVCSGTGWVEILGSGMVHPEVFKIVGYNPEEVTGFAFGMGVDRIAMLKYGIDDIRLFFENDMRFLLQF